MDEIDAVPVLDCPDCQAHMNLRAYLPAKGDLPAVAGYWCDGCQKDLTLEIDLLD